MGLYALFQRRAGALAARALVNAMFWTIVAYFVWHSLHARVEANWFAPVYPAFAIAAAVAANLVQWEAREQRTADFCLRWAAPTGILMFALLIVQANTGVLSGYRRDATVRSVGVGWREIGRRDRSGAGARRRYLRARAGLRHYRLARLLSAEGHLRRATEPAHPLGQHARARCGASLRGSCFMFTRIPRRSASLKDDFARVERVGEVKRKRGPLVDRDLCARSAGGAEGRRARPFAAAGTGVGTACLRRERSEK